MINALIHEKSPYLLQHAHNPVDWMPWGNAAFEKARREDKPIFLSIGYSTCHWCHVMARESFENEETAAVLNQYFVSIKVDREERPDIDRIYMAYVQSTTGHGGWPMSVWLTPQLKPFFGGTYFPPHTVSGRPGFPELLKRLADIWSRERDKIETHGERAIDLLKTDTHANPHSPADSEKVYTALFRQLARQYDPKEGGFGDAPKFPRPSVLLFLLYKPDGRAMALHTLRKMALGGIHDVLGGGFHRYSVDRLWHVPHFEKMLYDQAQLVMAYLEAFQITKDSFFSETARAILLYVMRDLQNPEGGFFSAEDADSVESEDSDEHAEGAFYVWTKQEIENCLGEDDARLFCETYGVTEQGNVAEMSDPFHEFTGKNIFIRKTFSAENETYLKTLRERLFTIRIHRPRPHLDDKVITAWNGLMVSAFAKAYQILGDSAYLECALRAVRFLKTQLTDASGKLLRTWRKEPGEIIGFAEDYAFLIQGLLDLYETDFCEEWLQWAIDLQEILDKDYTDSHGGYFSTTTGAGDVLVRMKEMYDGAEPSANSIAFLNLVRIGRMTENPSFFEKAERLMQSFADTLDKIPDAAPLMARAFALYKDNEVRLVIAATHEDSEPFLREIHQHYCPQKTLLDLQSAREKISYLKSISIKSGHPAIYLCENQTCRLPMTNPEQLRHFFMQG